MSETATIALNGEVQLSDFSIAINCFRQIVEGLTRDVATDAQIAWKLDGLEIGSAIATVRGQGDSDQPVTEVIRAYEKTGKALAAGQEIPYSDRVRKAANELMQILNGRVTSIRLETEDFDVNLFAHTGAGVSVEAFESIYGSVRGRVQSLSSRGSLRFTLYDNFDDHAISCYLRTGSEDMMREAWGKCVSVEGMVRRSRLTGRATAIRQVAHVAILTEQEPLDYREAIGCAPAIDGSISAEDAVRKIRDE